MTSKAATSHLYLLDCGEFVKIGQTVWLKDRIYTFDSDLDGIKIDLEESYFWKMDKPIAMGLEKTLIVKYQHLLYGHESSRRETFYSVAKDGMREDVKNYNDIFKQNIVEEKLSNYLSNDYKNGRMILRRKYKMKEVRI